MKLIYISTKENTFEFYFDEKNEKLMDSYKKLNGMI